MATLTDEQVDFVLADLQVNGIRLKGLRDNLLDHICILVEKRLAEGCEFEGAYTATMPLFYKKELYEIEEEALFLESIKGPYVALSRSQFFPIVLGLVMTPYIIYILIWWHNLRPAVDHRTWSDVLAGVMVFALFPILTTLVLFLTPDRFDPAIPRRS